MLDTFGVRETNWRDGIMREPNLEASETPFFVGRAIAKLAADPDVALKNGRVLTSWDLAEDADFDDVDGRASELGTLFPREIRRFQGVRRQLLRILARRANRAGVSQLAE